VPVPATLAEHWVVPLVAILEGLQATLTEAIVDVWEELKLAPPQPAIDMTPVNSKNRYNLRFIIGLPSMHRELPQHIYTTT
jgi:hypothetical protein